MCTGDGKGNMRGILSGAEGGMDRDLWDLFSFFFFFFDLEKLCVLVIIVIYSFLIYC